MVSRFTQKSETLDRHLQIILKKEDNVQNYSYDHITRGTGVAVTLDYAQEAAGVQ